MSRSDSTSAMSLTTADSSNVPIDFSYKSKGRTSFKMNKKHAFFLYLPSFGKMSKLK